MAKTKKLTQKQMETRILSQKSQIIRLKALEKARANLISEGWSPQSRS